jgi:hypothetical protein
MTDVEYFHFFLFLQNSVNNAMDMRFVAVKQVPESIALGCDRAAIWLLLEAENGLLQTSVPFKASLRNNISI